MNEIYTILLLPFYVFRKIYGIRLLWWKCHAQINCLIRIGRFCVDTIITCSKYTIPIKTKKRVVLNHGIDTKKFVPSVSGRISENKIISIGRIARVKKYENLIRAVANIKKKKIDVQVDIIGVSDKGDLQYIQELKEIIDKLDLKDVVFLKPAISNKDVVQKYQEASIFVSTTHTAFDKVVLEAMSCGVIPVVANRAYEEVLDVYGLFVEPDNIEMLAEKLERVLALGKDGLRRDMRRLVVKEYDITGLIKKIISL